MKARRRSDCMVCTRDIHPGDEIRHEDGIGWIHEACWLKLDQPIPEKELSSLSPWHGPSVKTYHQLAESNIQLDLMDEYDPLSDDLWEGVF